MTYDDDRMFNKVLFNNKMEINLRKDEIKKIPLERFFDDLEMLKDNNNRYICPFHDDTNPSMTIKDNVIWSCWACNTTGKDIIEFAKMYYKLDFIKAMELLETKYGLNNTKNIDFSLPTKNKIRKNRKEITFFINKVEDEVSNLIKNSNIKFDKRDIIFKKLDNMFLDLEILNYNSDEEVYKFKDKLINFETKVEELYEQHC